MKEAVIKIQAPDETIERLAYLIRSGFVTEIKGEDLFKIEVFLPHGVLDWQPALPMPDEMHEKGLQEIRDSIACGYVITPDGGVFGNSGIVRLINLHLLTRAQEQYLLEQDLTIGNIVANANDPNLDWQEIDEIFLQPWNVTLGIDAFHAPEREIWEKES